EIDPPPKFSPVLGPDGNLYVPDKNGGMTALSPAGEILWQFAQTEFTNLKPSAQATIASDGNIYLTLTNGGNGFMQALSPTGEHRWLTKADTFSFTNSPVLSVEEDLVFLAGDAFDAATGEKLTTAFEFKPDEFIAGENGHNYGRSDNTMFEWQRNGSQIELIETIEWPEPPPNFWGNQGTPTYIRVGADNV
ncbi:MAG: hypothetical protein GY803_14850, partial [Chloroflexi bacterium]|nr:hypothetical protein [Chloroflexota bacterium]